MKNSIETILSQTNSQSRVLSLVNTVNGQLIIEENDQYRWIRDNYNAYYSILDKILPERLVLSYLQTMMATLLFKPEPESALFVGAGGGALLRFFGEYFPKIKVQAIDNDETVIDLTEKYFLNTRLTKPVIINVDAMQFFAEPTTENADLIFIDLFSNGAIPKFFNDVEFYEYCRNYSASGILIFNLIIDKEDYFRVIMNHLFSVFNKRILCLTVPNYRNIIVLAFTGDSIIERDVSVLRNKCKYLQQLYKINFNQLLDEIISSNVSVDNVLQF
jgi:spermidine synthase